MTKTDRLVNYCSKAGSQPPAHLGWGLIFVNGSFQYRDLSQPNRKIQVFHFNTLIYVYIYEYNWHWRLCYTRHSGPNWPFPLASVRALRGTLGPHCGPFGLPPRTPVSNANLIICDYHCDDINCHHIEIGNRLLNPISCI